MWVGIAAVAAGCGSISPEEEKACLIGAGVGALAGGGIGAIAAAGPGHGKSSNYEIAVPAGGGGGRKTGRRRRPNPGWNRGMLAGYA
jgi:hypothetical protein